MRLRSTAAALVGALALVLPAAGLSFANDHDDRENLGTLYYRYTDEDGDRRNGQIHPADNDTCYRLTHTTENRPAFEVKNETESLAVVYSNRNCGGVPEASLEPGERLRDTDVASVYFKPVDDDRHEGRHDGRDDDREDGRHDGRHDGRDDDRRDDRRDDERDDEDRSHGGRAAEAPARQMTPDILDSVFRSIG
ncbi:MULTISPECIES: hypothetical protein [unclassified Streptomyces]|uniref:hypothetical protein n=1 Tax=unclassified Streptomyces TaxID=2593676 RepID=UPI000DC7A58E|nr:MULTISPECIES: hypothetical protein [unclassified Streptomyces]AWZ06197.1 hypothetical protein DRB89_17970 [Streptomyces sp. ICC4]AWZ13819.1 hypothetical protein DRB96_17665 [Streptomyces sp. ICC1]